MYIICLHQSLISQTLSRNEKRVFYSQELTLKSDLWPKGNREAAAPDTIITWHLGRGQENSSYTEALGKEQHCSVLPFGSFSVSSIAIFQLSLKNRCPAIQSAAKLCNCHRIRIQCASSVEKPELEGNKHLLRIPTIPEERPRNLTHGIM